LKWRWRTDAQEVTGVRNGILLAGSLLILTIVSVAIILADSIGQTKENSNKEGQGNLDKNLDDQDQGEVFTEIFYSPACDCCKDYIAYLKDRDLAVKEKETYLVDDVRADMGVPQSMASCHTIKIGGYFVEGHVPLVAIDKLIEERPDVDGIALPDMPEGSPGMDENKTEPFIIYSISNGEIDEFTRI
jgi:hypothetical protein